MRLVGFLFTLVIGLPAATAADVELCGSVDNKISSDGRLLNHFPYPVVDQAELVRPHWFPNHCRGVHRHMIPDLTALLEAARQDPAIGNSLILLSCFRSLRFQTVRFCTLGDRTVIQQAYQVAPPGFSEHATGLAIDFGDRNGGRCNLETCFAKTKVGRWLVENAPRFGFELSFPEGNAQGILYEPWHWRWIGRPDDPNSLQASATFAEAREHFTSASRDASMDPSTVATTATVAPNDLDSASGSGAEKPSQESSSPIDDTALTEPTTGAPTP